MRSKALGLLISLFALEFERSDFWSTTLQLHFSLDLSTSKVWSSHMYCPTRCIECTKDGRETYFGSHLLIDMVNNNLVALFDDSLMTLYFYHYIHV